VHVRQGGEYSRAQRHRRLGLNAKQLQGDFVVSCGVFTAKPGSHSTGHGPEAP
jgi:hypothetical protein